MFSIMENSERGMTSNIPGKITKNPFIINATIQIYSHEARLSDQTIENIVFTFKQFKKLPRYLSKNV